PGRLCFGQAETRLQIGQGNYWPMVGIRANISHLFLLQQRQFAPSLSASFSAQFGYRSQDPCLYSSPERSLLWILFEVNGVETRTMALSGRNI
ncbi:MAG: hypothetical protein WBH50_23450, partial [Fuerstiella sp.]